MLTYNLDAAVNYLMRSNGHLARLIQEVGPCTLDAVKLRDPFNALLRTIIYQQLSGKAAATIYHRVQNALGVSENDSISAHRVLSIDPNSLRGAGLSRAKLAAIIDLSEKQRDGQIPNVAQLSRLDDDTIIKQLTLIRGIGVWTVQMLLIFRLGRPDIWPTKDLGIRKGYAATFGMKTPPQPKMLEQLGMPFQTYRSVASWYLWRAADRLNTLT